MEEENDLAGKNNGYTISEKDLTKENLLAATDEAENLYDTSIEECLEDYYNDWDFESIKKIDYPTVFVYQKSAPFKLDAEDVMSYFEQSQCEQDCDNFDYKYVNELLKPLNNYLATISNTYECIGRIKDEEVKPVWEKLKAEWEQE